MAAYTPDQQLNWIRRYTSIRMSSLSEARANYFFFGIIIKEEFPRALWQALKSDFMWDNTPCDEWDLDELFFRATSNLSLSVTSTQLQMLRKKYRQLARAKMDPKTFNRFLDRARDAFTTLGVSTDSLDAYKKFSVVNEFSTLGLQSLINQPGQGSSDSNIWIKGRYLGAGSYGKVYTLTHYPTEIMVAMKIVEMQAHCTETTKEVKQLQNEIEILSKLRHERIVTCHGSERKGNHFYLFMDFMAEGSLYDYIKRKGNLDENLCRKFTRQILEGVNFLHSKEIIHRDIKGANVLLNRDGNVKLADFGTSRKIEKIGNKTNLKSAVGTVHWMAPEIVRAEVYGRNIDIWSVGCTVVEMLTGHPPLGDFELHAAMFHIGSKPIEPELPEGVSLDAIDFVRVALTWLPEGRPLSEQLLRHKFIQPVVSDHLEEVLMEVEWQFDAYIIYSSQDEEWVKQTLLPILEEKHGFKCCIHYRDFVVGELFKENIRRGVYRSRKNIAVVTRYILKSEYCKFELDMAVSRLLERRDDSVVVIKLDDIDTKQLPLAVQNRSCIDYPKSTEENAWEEKLVGCLKVPVEHTSGNNQ